MTHFRDTDSLFAKGSIRQHTQKTAGARKKNFTTFVLRGFSKVHVNENKPYLRALDSIN
jgi:hypothetical protein